eukprot:jgi/Tetstr1/465896/TSEL_010512.t1
MAFTLGDVKLAIRRWPTIFLQNSKTIFHYGYIPTIIVLGMTTTEPKPSLLQILGPIHAASDFGSVLAQLAPGAISDRG